MGALPLLEIPMSSPFLHCFIEHNEVPGIVALVTEWCPYGSCLQRFDRPSRSSMARAGFQKPLRSKPLGQEEDVINRFIEAGA